MLGSPWIERVPTKPKKVLVEVIGSVAGARGGQKMKGLYEALLRKPLSIKYHRGIGGFQL